MVVVALAGCVAGLVLGHYLRPRVKVLERAWWECEVAEETPLSLLGVMLLCGCGIGLPVSLGALLWNPLFIAPLITPWALLAWGVLLAVSVVDVLLVWADLFPDAF
ncbi:MAG TPA: hypothetical protein VFW96_21180 [Thermomicrobiales bacterium]|nr:hypothetical protein [Thermomicrobiales bacterium]